MKFNEYFIVNRAVEEGVNYGIRRVSKHKDKHLPTDEGVVAEHVTCAVINALCEVVVFEHHDEDEPQERVVVIRLTETEARNLSRAADQSIQYLLWEARDKAAVVRSLTKINGILEGGQ